MPEQSIGMVRRIQSLWVDDTVNEIDVLRMLIRNQEERARLQEAAHLAQITRIEQEHRERMEQERERHDQEIQYRVEAALNAATDKNK